jgi:2-polyprenyl-6-methoxyphenol hydroxylase-like FAD-dependent oxidoreductase
MNVVIAGGGVAGMTAAAVLRRLPFVKSIVMFEPFRSPNADSGEAELVNDRVSETKLDSNQTSVSHHYNGLWSPAITCLQSLGIYSHISRKLHPVLQSGYKDVSGRWLAQPTVGLQEPPGWWPESDVFAE